MAITISQLIISICVVLFIIFHFISTYKYKQNYDTKTIIVPSKTLIWTILDDLENYHKWWKPFRNKSYKFENIVVEESRENIMFKFLIKDLHKKEEWTFHLQEKLSLHYLIIKKSTTTDSPLDTLKGKIIQNKKDIQQFTQDLSALINHLNKAV